MKKILIALTIIGALTVTAIGWMLFKKVSYKKVKDFFQKYLFI